MSTKQLAFQYEDSVDLGDGLWYCEKKRLWWKDGVTYDERSANHNGLIGLGSLCRHLLKKEAI